MIEIPIRVVSYGGSAGKFSEDTCTLMVNRHGALIVLKRRLAPDQTIRIVNLENLREADFRVVGLARQGSGETAQWGVECLERDRCLWDIDFPPPLRTNDSNAGALLECQGCGKQRLLVLNLTEVDILHSAGSLEKLCENCGQLSSWVYADLVRRAKNLPSSEEAPPAPQVAAWDGKTQRRLHKRLALKLPVLIRSQKGEQELGRTENISQGGLAVCMSVILAMGELVTVICPYSGSGGDIEQKAEVRRRTSLFAGQKWLYGLRYVPK